MNLVEAVKTQEAVQQIASKLKLNARGNSLYADLWSFGLQVALRISDLLLITYDEALSDKKRLVVKEGKTGKTRAIELNSKALEIIHARRAAYPHHTFLFEVDSNRASGKPVSRVAVAVAFKAVGDEMGIALGTHSMRKTRGWLMHNAGVGLEMICKVLNHSNPATTMAYIGLTQSQVDATYHEFII